jgi:hypothetical protein
MLRILPFEIRSRQLEISGESSDLRNLKLTFLISISAENHLPVPSTAWDDLCCTF